MKKFTKMMTSMAAASPSISPTVLSTGERLTLNQQHVIAPNAVSPSYPSAAYARMHTPFSFPAANFNQ
jgi:hypothetical protein